MAGGFACVLFPLGLAEVASLLDEVFGLRDGEGRLAVYDFQVSKVLKLIELVLKRCRYMDALCNIMQ